jgi:uncharacterized protein YecE (DUF72 family)
LFELSWQQVSCVPVLIWAGQELAATLDSRALGDPDVSRSSFLRRLKCAFAERFLARGVYVKFWIGTSGFQYAEWKGNFYPEDLPAAKMLAFFAERLLTTEINYTFHRIPAAKTIDNWKQLTPEHFRFALKAPQKITHWSKLRDCADTLAYFCKVVTGLGERLGPVLFQLPPTFKKDADVLSSFLREFPTMRAAFEFRHDSWFDDEIFDLLKSRNIALCIADTADLSTPKKITSDYGYLRLRREDYNETDIERWATFVREQESKWRDAFVYFKHEEAGIGPKLAAQMVKLLE